MKKLLTVILALVPALCEAQHLSYYSFFPFQNLPVNPAMAGAEGHLNVTLSHRLQWAGLDGAPVTEIISAESVLKNPHIALGFTSIYDKVGATANWSNLGHFVYRVKMKGWLSFGLSAGFTNIRKNLGNLYLTDPEDPAFNNIPPSFTFSSGAGIYYAHRDFGAGIAVPGMISVFNRDETGLLNGATWHTHFHLNKKLSESITLQPKLLYRFIPEVAGQLDIGMNTTFKKLLTAGLYYRTKNALAGLIQYRLTNNLMVGYAYDKGISIMENYLPSSHEFMLRLDLSREVDTADPRYF